MKNFKYGWANVVGNADKISRLKNFAVDKNFPQSIIFSGVEGIGKRKIAEICAASLLCENLTDGEPCGSCDACKLMAAGTHPDFYVVEPEESKTARNIKIGQIRELQKETALRPVQGDKRVVIIDGAEFMNTAAANCVLKTLEEPQSQTHFILITANRAGLLMTIRSRCMTMNFDRLTREQIETALESFDVDALTAKKLSAISDGSLGRALMLEKSGGYELRDAALTLVRQIFENQLNNEIIFSKGKMFETYSREKFFDFVNYVQKILRDIFFLNTTTLYNADLKDKLAEINLPDDVIEKMLAEGTAVQRQLKSNATLRLIAEAYMMRLRKCVGS